MTKNSHVCAICCRLEVYCNVISGQNAKTVEGYIVVNFEVASSSSIRDFPKLLFCDREVGSGNSGMKVICSSPEVADDVISGENAETFQE